VNQSNKEEKEDKMRRTLISLAMIVLLVLTGLTLQGAGPLAIASPLAPGDLAETSESIIPAQTTCNSCTDCTDKLKSGLYVTVTLSVDITNHAGGCISLLLGESDVVLDCDGHTIDGDDQAVDPDWGIVFAGSPSNNTVVNCTVSDFSRGIQINGGSNNTILNNHVTSNGTGIDIGNSDSTDVRYNTVDDNVTGIDLHNATNSTIYNNIVCDNTSLDFNVSGGSGNTGDDNTCDKPDGWNDQGTTGCTNLCSGSVTCNSCSDCTSKLGGTFDRVLLNTDINNFSGGNCITFGADNIEFNCDGHTIDGTGFDYGVYMTSQTGNEIRNCTIRDFYHGIGLNNNSDNNIIDQNTIDDNAHYGIYLFGNSSDNTLSMNDLNNNGDYGIVLETSPSNEVYFNDLLCNDQGIYLDNADLNTISFNTVCSGPGPDFDVEADSTGNTGSANTCDAPGTWNDTGHTGCTSLCNSLRCSTCSDGVQSGDEDGVDCGGSYCPPCSQCSGEPTTKWAPDDTPCNNKWPTSDGPNIGMNTTSDSCNLVEVCDPGLDYILEDALTCCEHEDYAARFSEPRLAGKIAACNYAHRIAYHDSFITFNPSRLDTCLAHYLISGFGGAAVYMQGYMHGEFCCHGSDSICPSGCSKWWVDPAAWEMGTPDSCAGPDGETPDFQMGGHRCEYTDAWIFGNYGRDGYWNNDFNYASNSDSVLDAPTHASINRLSTGTCVDYSFAVTTMLRKAGYAADDVLSVQGVGHGYNLVRFPGEAMWHYVDTVGNRGGEVFGGADWPHPWFAWYDYCDNMTGGCSNDVHTQSTSHCPPDSAIFGCADGLLVSEPPINEPPIPTVTPDPSPGCISPDDVQQPDPTCTELSPCTEEATSEPGTPGPVYLLGVAKTASAEEITLGDSVTMEIHVSNSENQPIDVLVEETFVPGVAYDLTPKVRSYEGFTFQYYDWSTTVPAGDEVILNYTATPSDVGFFTFNPTGVYTGGHSYRSNSVIVKVICNPNGACDPGETHILCPEDCDTGIIDGYCDMVADGINDPDCADGADPDMDPAEDTDADGVLDGDDKCPLTPAGAFVDADGCTCEQKVCADEDPLTADSCNPSTGECEFTPDADQDEVPDAEDNCPNEYNPEQYDTDNDSIGDQCEIPPITANTTLDGGTYYVRDLGLEGAVVISASNVTLDCNGATLIGIDEGAGYGIYVPDSVDNVTIQNCTVQGYRYGLYVDSSSGNQLLDNTVGTNAFGIILGSASGNTISGNTASSNTQAGIYLEGCSGGQVYNNTVNSNSNVGLFIHTSSSNDVSNNTVCGNTSSDFTVYDSTNTGDDNTCDNPDGWNDEGTTGCTNDCGYHVIYLPLILRGYP
jgi:parallel beta-helix repeat protein